MRFTATGDQEMKNIQNPVPTYKIEVSELSKIREESSFEIINQFDKDPAKDRSQENNLIPNTASNEEFYAYTVNCYEENFNSIR